MGARIAAILLGAAAIVLGVGSEWLGARFAEPRQWIPDLAAGWALCAAGLVAAQQRPGSRVGSLLYLAGVTWFIPVASVTIANALGDGPGTWVSSALFVVHRAPLAHAILTYPSGRIGGPMQRVAVLAAYASVVLPIVWQAPVAVIAASGAFAGVCYWSYREAVGLPRRARQLAARVATGLAAVVVAVLIVRLVEPGGQGPAASILLYDLALIAASVALVVGIIRYKGQDRAVVDLVVDVGQSRGGGLREALANTLDDPSLELGYWIPEQSSYVDALGRRIALPGTDDGRAVTRIDRDGTPVAALIHDRAVLADEALVDAVSAAARLGSRNARLQAEIRSQLADLEGSRRRLINSVDDERERLEQRLREGARHRLERLADDIRLVDTASTVESESHQRLGRAGEQLTKTLEDLRDLARGMQPAELRSGGLAGALDTLAERSRTKVKIAIDNDGLPRHLEIAIYFLCAEALANANKHAAASEVHIKISEEPRNVVVQVNDDGVGGADLREGSGLLGLADRVEALGGAFRIESPVGHGTFLTAELPLDREG